MNNIAAYGVALTALLSVTGQTIAEISGIEEGRERARIYDGTKRSIHILGGLIRSELSDTELMVFNEIQTRIPRTPNIGPSASRIGGRRIVSIPLGVTVFSEQMAYAFHMSNANAEAISCWKSFLGTTLEQSVEQQGRRSRKEEVTRGFSFFQFASDDAVCQRSNLVSAYSVSSEVRGTVEASIAFFYLHEIAHHVLGHLDGLRNEGSNVRREIAADNWAIEKMLNLEIYPINATGALIPYILYNPTTTSHPAFSRRLTNIYDKMAHWLRESDKSWAGEEAALEALAMRDYFIQISRELDF